MPVVVPIASVGVPASGTCCQGQSAAVQGSPRWPPTRRSRGVLAVKTGKKQSFAGRVFGLLVRYSGTVGKEKDGLVTAAKIPEAPKLHFAS